MISLRSLPESWRPDERLKIRAPLQGHLIEIARTAGAPVYQFEDDFSAYGVMQLWVNDEVALFLMEYAPALGHIYWMLPAGFKEHQHLVDQLVDQWGLDRGQVVWRSEEAE